MSITVTLQLIQFVALALPAMGIYMTFAIETRIEYRDEFDLNKDSRDPFQSSPLGHPYHGMRVAVILLLGAGICYFINLSLLILQPSTYGTVSTIFTSVMEPFFLGMGILLTILSLLLFGTAIAFQQIALRDELTVKRSLGILRDQSMGIAGETTRRIRDEPSKEARDED